MKFKKYPGWETIPSPIDQDGKCDYYIYFEGVAVAGSKYPMTAEQAMADAIAFIEKHPEYEQHRTLIPVTK